MVNLITRPRRFGKTLNLSMLKYFFDVTEKDNAYIFDGLKISEYYKDFEEYRNTHPVISLSMKGGKKGNVGGMEVCVIKPSSFDDAREISETLLANHTVILNMEGIDLALAQRIIDFISGSCYAIDGNLQKVSNYIFIVTPSDVDISGDLQEIMNAFDFSGIQTGF